MEEAAEAVGGDGFDVIIENASDINLGSDLTVIGPGARVVVILSQNPLKTYPEFIHISLLLLNSDFIVNLRRT